MIGPRGDITLELLREWGKISCALPILQKPCSTTVPANCYLVWSGSLSGLSLGSYTGNWSGGASGTLDRCATDDFGFLGGYSSASYTCTPGVPLGSSCGYLSSIITSTLTFLSYKRYQEFTPWVACRKRKFVCLSQPHSKFFLVCMLCVLCWP